MSHVLRQTLVVAAAVVLLAPFAASAQNLGRLALLSRLGEPLDAEIEVTGVPAQARDSLFAQIVPIGVFERFGATPSPPLEVLRATVVSDGDGSPVVRLRSTVPVERPAVNVIIELAWNGGRMVRQYAFTVDPPDRAVAKAAAPAPTPPVDPAPAATAVPAKPPAAAKPAPKPKEKVAAKAEPKEKAAPKRPRASAAPQEGDVAAAENRVKDLERTMRELQERIDARTREIESLQREVGGTAK